MRNVEGDPSAWHNQWPILIDTESIYSVGLAWIFKEDDKWNFKPRVTGDKSLFYNAQFFLRLSLPLGIFYGMRLTKTRLFQCGIGWKLNGRLALLFRFQTDESAAKGVTGPNYGQSGGWDYGTH